MEGILYFLIAFLLMALIGSIAHEKERRNDYKEVIERKNSIIKDLTDQLNNERDKGNVVTTPFAIADAAIQECPNKEWLEEVIFYLSTYSKTLDILDKESEEAE